MNTPARLITVAMMVLLMTAVPAIEGNSSGKHSQAGQGCTCHSSTGTVTVGHNFPSTYMAGAPYSITVSVQGGIGGSSGGFNIIIDKGQLVGPGAGVQINGAQDSATHSSGNQVSWSFDWMAPISGSGTTTATIAVMETDANGFNNGDTWATLQVQIPEGAPPNDPPVASNALVAPSPDAYTNESLTLTYDYTDNENDPESSQTVIHWYVDGTHNTAHNGKTTIQASLTQAGQKWTAEVTPHDGTEFGSKVTSNEVTILDIDSDGDGVLDGQDAFPNDATETADSDNDGVGDNADAFPQDGTETTDSDNDGVGDNADAFPQDGTETTDSDNDGVGDNADAFPQDATETTDSDNDGVGDNGDAFPNDASETLDSDNDGVGDNADVFPNDASETVDTDLDGVGDNADWAPNDPSETADYDEDGVGDNADAFPQDPFETADTDMDGVGDNADVFPNDATQVTDGDGDGYGDNASGTNPDAFPEDANEWIDTDGDGVGDNGDAFADDATQTTDTDGDGYGDSPHKAPRQIDSSTKPLSGPTPTTTATATTLMA